MDKFRSRTGSNKPELILEPIHVPTEQADYAVKARAKREKIVLAKKDESIPMMSFDNSAIGKRSHVNLGQPYN